MTIENANKLQAEWGDKPCGHPDIVAERDGNRNPTDNWRCTECGKVVDCEEWQRSRRTIDPRD